MTKKNNLRTYNQLTAYVSPWPFYDRVIMLFWSVCWRIFCSWTPKPFNAWRLIWLRIFGAKIYGKPFVHQNVRIKIPWKLTLHDRACLGDGVHAYSLGEIEVFQEATVAQEAYLCTGTHKFDHPNRPLQTGKITIERHAFIGARAFVMPGLTIGERSIVGACSVVTKDVAPGSIVAGNPAIAQKKHNFK